MHFDRRLHLVLVLGIAVVLVGANCSDEAYDFERPDYDRGTLGEEVYAVVHRDLERTRVDSDRKAPAFSLERDGFVQAIDTMLPQPAIPAFEEFVVALLPLYDDNSIPDLVRRLADIYTEVSTTPTLLAAWSRSDAQRSHLIHESVDTDLIQRLFAFPRLRDVTFFTADLILEHDGIGPNGAPVSSENDYFRRILESIRDFIMNPDTTDQYSNLAVVADLLFRSDSRFGAGATGPAMHAVAPDYRGLPLTVRSLGGGLPAVFVDGDSDGFADITADGLFIGRDQQPFLVEPFGVPGETFTMSDGTQLARDEIGRAFINGGAYLYEYVDLNETPLGYLLAQTPEFIERGVVVDTFVGLQGLLGDAVRTGAYPHYTNETVLLDLTHALFRVSDFLMMPDLLEMVSILLDEHEEPLASFMLLQDDLTEINERHNAELTPNNAMLDNLLPFVLEIAKEKGLLEDVLAGLTDPVFLEIGPGMSELNTFYNDAIRLDPELSIYNQQVDVCIDEYEIGTVERVRCIVDDVDRSEIFPAGQLVDHTLPEGPNNTSLGQRVLHLIYDTAGLEFTLKIVEVTLFGQDLTETFDVGPLLTIPNLAEAFFDSVAGNFCLNTTINVDQLLENDLIGPILQIAEAIGVLEGDEIADTVTSIVVALSEDIGVHLDECPSAAQLLRFINLETPASELGPVYARMSVPTDREGYILSEHHGDTLYAAEAAGVLDALRPIVQPFSDRGMSALLVDTIAEVYRHYPEPGSNYVHADGTPADFLYAGMRRYEPAMIEYFAEERLLPLAQEVVGIILDIELSSTREIGDLLESFVAHLIDPSITVATRDGISVAVRNDGQPTAMSHYYLLMDAFDRLDAVLEADAEAKAAWDRASEEIKDLLFDVEEIPERPGRALMADPASGALAVLLIEHLTFHIRRHQEIGDYSNLLQTAYPAYLENLLTSRGFNAVVEMIDTVRQDPADQALFDELLLHLVAGTQDDPVPAALVLVHEIVLSALDGVGYPEMASFWGNLLDPDRRFTDDPTELPITSHLATILRRTLEVDPENVGVDMLVRAIIPPEGQQMPLEVIARAIRQVHRRDPGAAGEVDALDFEQLYERLADFIRDDRRGLERVFEMVRDR